MFDNLSEKLGGVLDRLTRRGALTEAEVDGALREVRRTMLEADVALDVVRTFADGVKKQTVGVEVMKSVSPGQMVVKIVHDQLIATLGTHSQGIDLNAVPPRTGNPGPVPSPPKPADRRPTRGCNFPGGGVFLDSQRKPVIPSRQPTPEKNAGCDED